MEEARAVPLPELALVPPVPRSPEFYASVHLDRIAKFRIAEEQILRNPERERSPWRHELEHDAESVFWHFLYWAIVVHPADSDGLPEEIDPVSWASLVGPASSRDDLVGTIAQKGVRTGLVHSIYKPLSPLIKNLASTLVVDRQWLAESDVRNDPAYIGEAFQRLILQFMLDHRDEEFMNCEADVKFRSTKQMLQSDALSVTSSELMGALDRKRPSPRPSMDYGKGKRRRLDVVQRKVRCQCGRSSGFHVMFCRMPKMRIRLM